MMARVSDAGRCVAVTGYYSIGLAWMVAPATASADHHLYGGGSTDGGVQPLCFEDTMWGFLWRYMQADPSNVRAV